METTTIVGDTAACYCDYETWPKPVLIIILLASIFCMIFSIVKIKEKNSKVFLIISSIMAFLSFFLLMMPILAENLF